VILQKNPDPAAARPYEVLTGNLRIEACRRLGWKTIPAIVRPYRGEPGALPRGRQQP
jgi:ParB-like chromosome segregation protein Spo0J